MCVVSNIGDEFNRRVPYEHPWVVPSQPAPDTSGYVWPPTTPTKAEFDALKKDVEDLKEALIKGKQQDIEEGNADCEMEDKIALLKKVAELVGVDLDDVFG